MSSRSRGFLYTPRITVLLFVLSALSWAGDTKKASAPAPAPHPAAPAQHAPAANTAHPGGAPNTTHPGGTTNNVHPGGTTNTMHPGGTTNTMHPGGTTNNVHPTPGGPPVRNTSAGATGPGRGPTPGSTGSGAHPTPGISGRASGTGNGSVQHNTFQPGANSSYKATSLPKGGTEYHDAQSNRTIRTDPAGHVTHITAQHGVAGSMTINHSSYGRVVETGHPGNRVVNYGPHHGYVERPLRHGYYSRTYVYGNRRYAVVYREYGYRGYHYYRYVPAYYYGPRFYSYAYNPWPAPVYYAWGGPIAAPWVYAYPTYFAPAPVYYSPDSWLTDYLLTQNLQAAYQAQQAAAAESSEAAAASTSTPISPEVRAAIADEVKQQIAEEQAAAKASGSGGGASPGAATGQNLAAGNDAGGGPPPPEAPPPAMNLKFFVVSSPLDVAVDGQPCALTPGDIIERRGKEPDANGEVKVEVVSSKPGDCTADSDLNVKMADLQEMHNNFRENIDAGLKVMADNDSTSKGLPKSPDAQVRNVAEGTCQASSDADSALVAQQDEAARLEAQVVQN